MSNYLCKLVEWTLSKRFKSNINSNWKEQQVTQSTLTTQLKWVGPFGLGSRIAIILSRWQKEDQKNFKKMIKKIIQIGIQCGYVLE